MERLTAIRLQKHIDECKHRIGKINEFVLNNRDADTVECAKNVGVLINAINSLEEYKKYKNLEEQGLLPKCKPGDMVYMPHRGNIVPFKVTSVTIYETKIELRIYYAGNEEQFEFWGITIQKEDIGHLVFLTQAEAEDALKKMGQTEI